MLQAVEQLMALSELPAKGMLPKPYPPPVRAPALHANADAPITSWLT